MGTVKEANRQLTEQLKRFYDPAWGLDLPEADNGINGASRAIIAAMKEETGAAWLGKINLYGKDHGNPKAVIIWKWRGGMVYNFGAAFVLPCYDRELARMIKDRDNAPYTGTKDDAPLVAAIIARIAELGGVTLIWT